VINTESRACSGDELLIALTDAAEKTRIVVVDAFTDNDINTIATAAARLEATLIRPEIEFGSLIMGGVIENGPFSGLKVVTKGGLVGDQNVLVGTLVWFLKE